MSLILVSLTRAELLSPDSKSAAQLAIQASVVLFMHLCAASS